MSLSPVEFRLLEYLIERRGTVITREELLENVWNLEWGYAEQDGGCACRRAAQKIEADPRYPRLLLTVKGAGYKLSI